MALNGAHAGKGVLLYAGECIILYSDNVSMEFKGSIPSLMQGSKTGRLYLTTHRMIFNNKSEKDPLQSFATPFFCMKEVELEQPVFGANCIKCYVKAQTNGGFTGEAKLKLTFKHGGAIEYGQAMLKVASMATRNINQEWREAPPRTALLQDPGVKHLLQPIHLHRQDTTDGFPTAQFPDRPPTDGVFMYDAPPPYPGISVPGAYPAQNPQGGYPPQNPQAGYPTQGGYPPQAGFMAQGGYPPQNGYPVQQAAFAPPSNAKAQEASQSAYYDPNNPQYAFVPPPPYSPSAPNYDDASKKMN